MTKHFISTPAVLSRRGLLIGAGTAGVLATLGARPAGAGDDAIYGGFGRDLMASQAGNDRFVYKSVLDSLPGATQRDSIVDWSAGHDRIDLRAIDSDLQHSGNQAFSWIGSKAFSGSGGEVRSYFDGRSTIVEADVNGDRQADLQIELWSKHVMKISDFLL